MTTTAAPAVVVEPVVSLRKMTDDAADKLVTDLVKDIVDGCKAATAAGSRRWLSRRFIVIDDSALSLDWFRTRQLNDKSTAKETCVVTVLRAVCERLRKANDADTRIGLLRERSTGNYNASKIDRAISDAELDYELDREHFAYVCICVEWTAV